MNRYGVPLLPGFALVGAAGTTQLWQAMRTRAARRALTLVLGALVAAQLVQLSFGVDVASATWRMWRAHEDARRRVGEWLDQHTSADTLVLSSDVAAIGWYSRRPILDGVGLVSSDALSAVQSDTVDTLLKERRPALMADSSNMDGSVSAAEVELGTRLLRTPDRAMLERVLVIGGGGLYCSIWRITWYP